MQTNAKTGSNFSADQQARVAQLRRRLHWSILAFFLLAISGPVLGYSAETAVTLSPVSIVLYLLIATYIGKLAAATDRNGWGWGLLAVLIPLFGVIAGYLFVCVPTFKYRK